MKPTLPALALLETTHEFPGAYLFKIIGSADQSIVARIIAIFRQELAVEVDPPFRVRESAGGRHLSVTVEPTVQSAHQVLAIYRRLSELEGIVMLF